MPCPAQNLLPHDGAASTAPSDHRRPLHRAPPRERRHAGSRAPQAACYRNRFRRQATEGSEPRQRPRGDMRDGQGHADLAGHRNLPDQRAASARDKNRRALGCSSARCGLRAAGQARTWPRSGLPIPAAVRSIPGAPPRGSQASPQALAPARSIERNPPAETFFSHFSHFFHYFLHFVPRTSRRDSLNLSADPGEQAIDSTV